MSRAIIAVAVVVLALGAWLRLRDTRPTNTAKAPMDAPELEQRVTAELEPAPVEAVLWSGRSPSHREFEFESGRFTLPLIDGLHRIDIRRCKVAGDPLDSIAAGEMLTVRGILERSK